MKDTIELCKDMSKNLSFKETSDGKLIWIPTPSDTLDDLIKENKVNMSYLRIKGQPHISNWEELTLEIERREAPTKEVGKKTKLSKSDKRKAYFSEIRLTQWTWFGRIAAVLFFLFVNIVIVILMGFWAEYYTVFNIIDILCFLYALTIPGKFVEISNCMRLETGYRYKARFGRQPQTGRLPGDEIHRINRKKLKIQKRLGIVLTDEEMEEWKKYL